MAIVDGPLAKTQISSTRRIVMANKVAGELYESITGQLFEIGRQLRQPNGYPFDPLQLKESLQAAIEGSFMSVDGNFRYDKRTDGSNWKLLENQPRRRLISANIEAVSFLKRNETVIGGEEMVSRAVELNANYGQEDAEFLLEHQDEIPKELRSFYLVFPRTKWQDLDGFRRVSCLRWGGVSWFLYFSRLGGGWDSGFRLVRLRK